MSYGTVIIINTSKSGLLYLWRCLSSNLQATISNSVVTKQTKGELFKTYYFLSGQCGQSGGRVVQAGHARL